MKEVITTKMKLRPGVFAICIIGCFIISCKDFDFNQPGDKYYYYPSKNVYYDVKRSNFLYSLDSGKTWVCLFCVFGERGFGGFSVTVYNTTGEVWKDNEAHRKLYNGTVLNVINEASLRVPEPKKIVARNTSKSPKEPEKKERKRPIKRFFQKLFGKKK
jgi:hypothetical protein